jgi:CBS domain-containing protein
MTANVQDTMTTEVVAVKPGASFKEMTARLRQSRVSAFPVIDDDGRLAGIISRADVLAVFDRSDEEIRKQVTDDVICHEFGAAPRQFAVTVPAGVVTLEGKAETAALGHVIVRKVRHVQGVVAVRDRPRTSNRRLSDLARSFVDGTETLTSLNAGQTRQRRPDAGQVPAS